MEPVLLFMSKISLVYFKYSDSSKLMISILYLFFLLAAEEDSVNDRREQEQIQDNSSGELEKNEVLESPRAEEMGEMGKSMMMKREDSKLTTLSGRVFNCQGKNLRINIPLTTPSRTFSAISYLVWGDLVNQSSNNCNPEGSKLRVNKTKLHHAEKMIKGAFIELYKGLRYLETYRYLIEGLLFLKKRNKRRSYCIVDISFGYREAYCLQFIMWFQELEHACFYKDFEEIR